MSQPPAVVPDTKDWTWVLDARCPECGFVAADVDVTRAGDAVRDDAAVWAAALGGPAPSVRPRPGVWSVTEYACHVRDVDAVFAGRLRRMLTEQAPRFENWDQDATAVERRYDLAEPGEVGAELLAAADDVAAVYNAVRPEQRARRGRRGDGSSFTVDTLTRYHLHDLAHHRWDVRREVTVAGYHAHAASYRDASAGLDDAVRTRLDDLVSRLPAGARVLEVGSGGGRDARALEERGVDVRRTDVTPGFVDLLRAAGHAADVVDPLVDDLADPAEPGRPYDGVWANASLLHVARADLPTVLARLAAAVRAGGVLALSVKEGDGEGWSTHGSVAVPRMFTYWREPALRDVLAAAGWEVAQVHDGEGRRGERWLQVVAYRGPT